jgi:F-type H+-transporting ATPase subunit c
MDVESAKYFAVAVVPIALGLTAVGVSKIFSSACTGVANNPSAESSIAKFAFIGGALTEAMGLFALVLGLILIF